MLEQKDLQAIAELIDTRAAKTETMLGEGISALDGRISYLDGRINALDERISALDERISYLDGRINALDERISYVERMIVNELVRTEDKLSRRIGKVEKSIEALKQHCRANKMCNDNITLTL